VQFPQHNDGGRSPNSRGRGGRSGYGYRGDRNYGTNDNRNYGNNDSRNFGNGNHMNYGNAANYGNTDRYKIQCQVCYKFGHSAADCYHRFNPNYVTQQYNQNHSGNQNRNYSYQRPNSQPQQNAQAPQAYLANANPAQQAQNWYIDSEATHHVTASPQNLMNEVPTSGNEHVFLGNGQGLPIISTGSAIFQSPFASNVKLTLNNLLHVPHITKNLVSVSQFVKDNNVFFEFHSSHCVVKSQVDGSILPRGALSQDGLYVFSNLLNSSVKSTVGGASASVHMSSFSALSSHCNNVSTTEINNSNSSLVSLWHNRLGHPSSAVVTHVLKDS